MSIGDHLSDVKVLWGIAGCADTSKCLFTAAEKGVDIEGRSVDLESDSQMSEILKISPFGSIPVLKDVDFYVYGVHAIMSYLDDKGFGKSLVPRNGVARAKYYQWIHIADHVFAPNAGKLKDGDVDEASINAMKDVLATLEEQLTTKTQRGDYIVGEFTLADIYWAPYIHYCCLYGQDELINALPKVKEWWAAMKVRKSMSKEDYVAYTVLPSLQEIRDNKLGSVSINVSV